MYQCTLYSTIDSLLNTDNLNPLILELYKLNHKCFIGHSLHSCIFGHPQFLILATLAVASVRVLVPWGSVRFGSVLSTTWVLVRSVLAGFVFFPISTPWRR